MTAPQRKPEQAVEFDGAHLPRGTQEGRACDLRDCIGDASALVSSPDGSVLLVCAEHGEALTVSGLPPVDRRTSAAAARTVGGWVPKVRVSVVARLVVGVALTVWGLSLCARAGGFSDIDGTVTGSLGMLLVISTVRPRRRR